MSGSTQKFEDPSGKPLASIVSHTDRTLNSRYVLWDEVEKTLANISHLQDTAAQRVFFEVDKEYNLIVPLRVVYSSIPYVAVVRAEEVDGQARARRWPLTLQKEAINPRTWLQGVSKNKDRTNATSNNHLDSLLEITFEAQEHMALRGDMHNLSEQNFLKAVATSDYYKQALLTKIDSLRSADSSLEQELGKIVDELTLLDQELIHLYEHHRLNKCQAIMDTSDHSLEYPAPHLFLVLPSNLALWDDMDPATHTLRLYFMCDSRSSAALSPQHIHLMDHPGYDLDRPLEFFQQYGQYVLTLLNMVKHGYSRGPYSVPPLDTCAILNCHGAPVHHSLTRYNIGPLVDKAIAYISQLSFKKSLWKILLNPGETRRLGSFIHLKRNDGGFGGLYRVIEKALSNHVHWRCSAHAAEHSDNSRLESIVGTLEGKLDRCLSTIVVPLASVAQAMGIATALLQIKSVYDVTIRLNWIVSRDELRDVLSLMARSGVAALQLDGLTSKTRVHNFENEEDLFVEAIGFSVLQLAALLNYPQSSEQYVYLGRTGSDVYGLQLSRSVELPHFDWLNMRIALDRGLTRITDKKNISFVKPSLKDFFRQLVFETDLNVRGVDLFDRKTRMWQGRLGVKDDVVIGPSDTIAPSSKFCTSILEYGTLRALRLKTEDAVDIPYLCSLIELNPGLQYLDIPAQEERIFKYLRPVWSRRATGQLQVVLRELSPENVLHRIASLTVRNKTVSLSLLALSRNKVSVGPHQVDVSRWKCDYVSGARTDQDTNVLDVVTLHFPSVITSLTLNFSSFSRSGLSGIQNVLRRSSLERLVIQCSHFDPSLRKQLGHVLSDVLWPTIKSISLIGDKIDDWIWIWTKFGDLFGTNRGLFGPRLSCLNIVGLGSADPLSHFSALSLHRLIYLSDLAEVRLENIQLQDHGDWNVIIGAIDFASLKSLSFLNSAVANVDNVDTLVDRLKEQLPDLELIVFTSSLEEKHFTFVSLLGTTIISETQYHELEIEGIDWDPTSDIWHTLAPVSEGFQYGVVRATRPHGPSSPRVLKSSTLQRAFARPGASLHLYQFRSIADRGSELQRIKLPTRKESISHFPQRHQRSTAAFLDMSVTGRPWSHSSLVNSGVFESEDKTGSDPSAIKDSQFMTDHHAALLDASSARHPFSLSTLDLNIVCLTMRGLASLRNVLQRSTLEHLKINCVPISEELWDDVFQLLKSLRPSTLKSLVLGGDNIDEWLWLWVKGSSHPSLHGSMSDQLYLCPVLQKLKIAGAQKLQPLGRKSASFILHLIRSSQLQELRLLNIEIVHEDDWDLIAGTIEKSQVTSLELSSRLQALMKKHFWYHFREKNDKDSLFESKCLGLYKGVP
ncbi:hypothetical protein MVEG_00695 [Podila verticillata NRRL 6337]|nr:hypothetical protein MVEG_00695 [Podila verticillata NRRL 6337]